MTSPLPSEFVKVLTLIKASIKDGKVSEFFLLKMYRYLFMRHSCVQRATFEHHIALECGDGVGAQYRDFASNYTKVQALMFALDARKVFFLLSARSSTINKEAIKQALIDYRRACQSEAFLEFFPNLLNRDPEFFARVDKELIADLTQGRGASNAEKWKKSGSYVGNLFCEVNQGFVKVSE
jgi:hypothetical protein